MHPSHGVPQVGLSAEDLDCAFDLPDPDDLVANVSALIGLELLDQYPKLTRIGQRSRMTTRTLQRQLQRDGVRFSDLVQDALQRRAFSLLRHTDQTVTEIAALLGYNDAAHFTRAFERWSGTSPRAHGNRANDGRLALTLTCSTRRKPKAAAAIVLAASAATKSQRIRGNDREQNVAKNTYNGKKINNLEDINRVRDAETIPATTSECRYR